ncbi:MAG: hypothetical protein ACTHJR_08785 [Sphingomonas sp.]|uniref:hypothetical protein n=1 Tax=Sphingomonas sp. TaxID=28214 RepID=UPI003F7F1110
MAEDPMIYWKRRAEAERDLAEKAPDAATRKAHEEMALLYEERALNEAPID